MDPDLFITIVFVSWVTMFGAAGALVARREQLHERTPASGGSTLPIVEGSSRENDPGVAGAAPR